MGASNQLEDSKRVKHKSDNAIISQQASVMQAYSGPIPQADELAKYERILPGTADRIIVYNVSIGASHCGSAEGRPLLLYVDIPKTI